MNLQERFPSLFFDIKSEMVNGELEETKTAKAEAPSPADIVMAALAQDRVVVSAGVAADVAACCFAIVESDMQAMQKHYEGAIAGLRAELEEARKPAAPGTPAPAGAPTEASSGAPPAAAETQQT